MARVGDKNGTGTDKQGGLTDNTNSAWALSQSSLVSGVRGFAVNKGGADTSFPSNRCSQLFLKDNVIYGKKIKGGWYFWNGTTWVINNDPRNY